MGVTCKDGKIDYPVSGEFGECRDSGGMGVAGKKDK
jgi:hypothetical protein